MNKTKKYAIKSGAIIFLDHEHPHNLKVAYSLLAAVLHEMKKSNVQHKFGNTFSIQKTSKQRQIQISTLILLTSMASSGIF